ncbi:hypothetical protein HJG60_011205 [Phyllostomus discolor]|uniref:Uncharacterized protein n=1 Tax=Phyllostomus discolor TaxID=89673 RepID=A0A834A3N4_9CHIR|nr:hypothetical protein HJG60_011205 [Phyllostomus discolor]
MTCIIWFEVGYITRKQCQLNLAQGNRVWSIDFLTCFLHQELVWTPVRWFFSGSKLSLGSRPVSGEVSHSSVNTKFSLFQLLNMNFVSAGTKNFVVVVVPTGTVRPDGYMRIPGNKQRERLSSA